MNDMEPVTGQHGNYWDGVVSVYRFRFVSGRMGPFLRQVYMTVTAPHALRGCICCLDRMVNRASDP